MVPSKSADAIFRPIHPFLKLFVILLLLHQFPIFATMTTSNSDGLGNKNAQAMAAPTALHIPSSARMQFTIELTNLTHFIMVKKEEEEKEGKMKAEGRTGVEGDEAEEDIEEERINLLRELFPIVTADQRRGHPDQIKTTAKSSSKINAILAVSVIPRNKSLQSSPPNIHARMVPKITLSPLMTTVKSMAQPTTTTALPKAATKATSIAGTTTPMPKLSKSFSPTTAMMASTTSIPLPIRLRFLLTRRAKPFMTIKKIIPQFRTTTFTPPHSFPTIITRPNHITITPTAAAFVVMNSTKKPLLNGQIQPIGNGRKLHDSNQPPPRFQMQPPMTLPSAPGNSPKPPGTMAVAADEKQPPRPLPMASPAAGGGCGEQQQIRKEIDGDTQQQQQQQPKLQYNPSAPIKHIPSSPPMIPQPPPTSIQRSHPIPQTIRPQSDKSNNNNNNNGGGNRPCCPSPQPQQQQQKCCRPKCFDCPLMMAAEPPAELMNANANNNVSQSLVDMSMSTEKPIASPLSNIPSEV